MPFAVENGRVIVVCMVSASDAANYANTMPLFFFAFGTTVETPVGRATTASISGAKSLVSCLGVCRFGE